MLSGEATQPAALSALTDREIDALVAERVMGISLRAETEELHLKAWVAITERYGKEMVNLPSREVLEKEVAAWRDTPKPYSSDGNAMLEVKERIHSRKLTCETRQEVGDDLVRCFILDRYGNCTGSAMAKTEPRSVAEAALLALAGEHTQGNTQEQEKGE